MRDMLKGLKSVFASRLKNRQCFDFDKRIQFEIEDPKGASPPRIIRGSAPSAPATLLIENPWGKTIWFTEKTGFFECPAKITRVVHV
ncbi:MAG: hypothetical protein H6650_01325 [Ardenticatenales bacterium]|nr:hypothetical protein [Ardenticatenales bacterium]